MLLRILIGLALLAGAILIALYGVFAILYGGDAGSGDTYVEFGGSKLDADSVGGVALLIAFVATLVSMPLLGPRWVLVGLAFGLAVPAAVFGIWLVSIEDPEGAAQFVGGVVIAASAAVGLVGSGLLWGGRSRCPRG